MKWFDKWFAKKCKQAWENSKDEPEEAVAINTISARGAKARRIGSVRESDELGSEPITFKMFKASGGWAIEFRQYDNKHDRVDTSLYVVNDEEELGKHISQIITMEALKR
jgi:hypothetical protein